MRPGDKPARNREAATLEFGGETLVYHRLTGEVHRLDSVGSIVWRFLDGVATVEQTVGDLATAFEVDPSAIRSDVVGLLGRLERAFLLADGPVPVRPEVPARLVNPPSP